ncbi:hypothetical protein [Azospirillum brasilense]|uniref:hypothetical protein n=1 Tax=Azospirillum brasilense TaxID=192 RepID=UPI001EDAF6E1|nr:hypothetical protein [Azospirillum brasilense]UKJ74517.1 hypothetical protein H1Q64_18335 [Azospirillum brasilense]
MSTPPNHTGAVYGYPVRFLRLPLEPGQRRRRGELVPLCVVHDDLVTALDVRPAAAFVLRRALAMHTGCGWGTVKIGRRSCGAPQVDLARWLVESALALGFVGRRALADYDRAAAEAEAALGACPDAATQNLRQ